MREIIMKIWELPWYKVAVVAVADDMILFVKLWPVWVVMVVVAFIIFWRKV